jgi:hypothetical protein
MSEEWKHRHDWSQTRTLYVVLQGEFALYHEVTDNPIHDKLRILAPHLPEPEHEYKGGPWLTDWKNAEPLPRRPLRLRNAIGDRKQYGKHSCRSIPEQNGDIFMRLGPEKLCATKARLDISGPLPLAILPGLTEPEGGTVIKVQGPNGPFYPQMPPVSTLIPILVYKWFADHRPYLWDEETDQKWISGGPSDDFQSLQIYASSSGPESTKHARHAFHAAAALLGADAEIVFDEEPVTLIPATPPAGLSYAQVNWFFGDVVEKDPCDRILRLDHLDRLPERLPVGGPSGNCGPITGGGGGG